MSRKIKGDLTVENDLTVDNELGLSAEATERALQLDASGKVKSSAVTSTELGYLSGVTSAIQTQLDAKAEEIDVVLRDGTQAFTGDQSMGGNRLTNLAAPVDANDAARKIDVDTAAAGIKVKAPVDVVSLVDITLSGEQTIDGVLTSTSRVLVAGQTDPVENGIYVSAAGAWTRATDFDGAPNGEVQEGNVVLVQLGTVYSDTLFILNNSNAADPTSIAVGTDEIEFTVYSRAESVQAGDGLDKTGLTLSVDVSDFAGFGLEDDGTNNLRVSAAAAGTGLTGGGGVALAIDFDTTGEKAVSADVLASTATGEGASLIGVEDSAANFTGTTVEAVLAELQSNIDTKQDDVITTQGDIIVGDVSGEAERLAIGASGTVLRSNGTTASWQPLSSPGDIAETSFAGANNQSLAANVTGLSFANATVRSFKVHGSIHVDATSDLFEEFELHAIQRGADWVMSDSRTGDDTLVTFTITNAGQIQYTSGNYTGFVSLTIKFRAITTSV